MVRAWSSRARWGASCVFVASAILIAVTATAGHAETFCGATVKSGIASGKTETEAKAAATTWWSSRAGSLGEGYQNWDLAKDKALNCHQGPFSTFKCTASAKPCLPDDPKKKDL